MHLPPPHPIRKSGPSCQCRRKRRADARKLAEEASVKTIATVEEAMEFLCGGDTAQTEEDREVEKAREASVIKVTEEFCSNEIFGERHSPPTI